MKEEELINSSVLNKDFVATVQEFKDFMIRVEDKIKEFERETKILTQDKQIKFIDSQAEIFKKIDVFFNRLCDIAKDLSRTEASGHKTFMQKEILHYFMRDSMPLNKQIYTKPLGYAGDYVVMNYLYENGYPGDDTYSKFIDRYTLSVSPARAHIYRRPYFGGAILDVIEKNIHLDEIKIASIACGPAIELLDVLKEHNIPENVKFFCIDGEKKAIDQIQANLREIEAEKRKKFSVDFLNENILQMIRKKVVVNKLKDQSFIYCGGFLDYLSDKVSFMLVKYLFGLLREGGTLVLVNMYKEDPSRVYLEMLGEWYLKHRDEREMMRMAEGLSAAKEVKIDFDPETKTNIYLIIRK